MPNDLDQIVICVEDCEGCEHNRPHKYSSCQSSCDGGGDYECPACVLAKDEVDSVALDYEKGSL